MYEEFYGFSEPPFSLTPDPKFFFQGESHIRAFELLKYGIHRGEGFIVVYGDIGTGKTTLCRTVLEGIPKDVYTALLLNPFLSETDLLRAILQDFGVLSPGLPKSGQTATKHDLITALNTFLLSINQLNGRAVMLIDEAQNIPAATLEQIRILSNLETAKQKLLQIVLVGQSELKEVLARPELRQLAQRISLRCELEPFGPQETIDYVRHRMSVASGGKAGPIFTPDAFKVIHKFSQGTPRLINLIADRCLTAGLAAGSRTIDAKIAKQAVENLELKSGGGNAKAQPSPWKWIAITALLTLVLAALLLWAFNAGLFAAGLFTGG
jgi:general secretion pathway protein A